MKKHIVIMVAVLSALMLFSGCSKIKEISVTSFELVSVTPKGLTELDALVKIGIHNPAVPFELTDAVGTLKIGGSPCLSLSADQLIVSGNMDKVYSLPIHGVLAEGFNPFQLLTLLKGDSIDLENVTADVDARISLRGGVGKNLELKDIKLSKLLKKE